MSTIFSKIIAGTIPAHRIAETSGFLAFLDINPVVKGHTIVIPKKEIDQLFDLDDETFIGLHLFSKMVSGALRASIPCKRIATAVIGLEVPHCHIHLLPINTMTDVDFNKPRVSASDTELANVAELIRKHI
jgi:histidine triad (HIT) family protein